MVSFANFNRDSFGSLMMPPLGDNPGALSGTDVIRRRPLLGRKFPDD
jgi:hypothetical protein